MTANERRSCEELRDALSDFMDGRPEAGSPARAAVESHLAGCEACREYLEDMRAVSAAFRAHPGDMPAGRLEAVVGRAMAEIRVSRAAGARRRRLRLGALAAAALAAAAVLVAALLAFRGAPERYGGREPEKPAASLPGRVSGVADLAGEERSRRALASWREAELCGVERPEESHESAGLVRAIRMAELDEELLAAAR